jgi:hypothetical protein
MDITVVSTALPELIRWLQPGRDAVLLDGDDPAVYAGAIADLLARPAQAAALARAGRAKVLDHVKLGVV